MAALGTPRSALFHTAPRGTGLGRLAASFVAWRDARATRKALSALSDRELDDIGIKRSDIASFTLRG